MTSFEDRFYLGEAGRWRRLRRDLRLIVRVLKPLADEVRPLFTGEKLPTSPQPDLPGEGGVSDTGAR